MHKVHGRSGGEMIWTAGLAIYYNYLQKKKKKNFWCLKSVSWVDEAIRWCVNIPFCNYHLIYKKTRVRVIYNVSIKSSFWSLNKQEINRKIRKRKKKKGNILGAKIDKHITRSSHSSFNKPKYILEIRVSYMWLWVIYSNAPIRFKK